MFNEKSTRTAQTRPQPKPSRGTEARVAGAGDNLENDNDDDNLYTIHVDLALCRMSTRATTENTAKEWLR